MEVHNCFEQSKVVDCRMNRKSTRRRRRRECLVCKIRFTTTEVMSETILTEAEQKEHKEQLQRLIRNTTSLLNKIDKL